MKELLRRLFSRPGLAILLILAALFSNLLALAPSLFVIQVLNRYLAHGVDATLTTLAVGAVIAILLEMGFRRVRMRMANGFSAHQDERLSLAGYDVLSTASVGALATIPKGRKRSMVLGADTIRAAYSAANINAVLDLPFALLFIGVLYLLSPTLASIAAGMMALVFLVGVVTGMQLAAPTRELAGAATHRERLVAAVVEAEDTVRGFNTGPFLLQRWRNFVHTSFNYAHHIASRQAKMHSFIQASSGLMTIAIIGVGATLVVAGELDVGVLIGANILAGKAMGPISRFALMHEQLAKAAQAMKAYSDFSRLPMERQSGTALKKYQGGIALEDLAFSHPGNNTPLFESVNLRLNPGMVLAVNGSNGSGKTTLARLFVGLLSPTRGQILADGVDLRQLAAPWWREQLIYLPQEPKFVAGTLRDNLLLGREDIGDETISQALETAGLKTFLDQKPDGLDTNISETGQQLSLGVRRRLALARALLKSGRLVIFDEPTEGMDVEGSAMIYRVLNQMVEEKRTIILFSHDKNLLKGAHLYLNLSQKPIPGLTVRQTKSAKKEVKEESK
ncbi:MAG: ATP-binding cassette domain-containing protein [Candidatus Sedimenticola sp. (ex Thyasira tokunagai)]